MTEVEKKAAPVRRRSRFDRQQRRYAAVAVAAVGGMATLAQPTGLVGLDQLWCAVLAGAGAFLGSYARRGPLLIALSGVALVAPDRLVLLPVLVGLVAAVASTSDLRRPAPFLRGLSGGGAVCALLVASSIDGSALLRVAGWLIVAVPLVASALRQVPVATRRRLLVAGGVVAGVMIGACLLAGFGALAARQQIDRGTAALDLGLVAARSGDVETARQQLRVAGTALDNAAGDIGIGGLAARAVPGASQNVRAVEAVLAEAAGVAEQAEAAAGVVDNEALSLDGGALDVDAVAALAPPLGRLVTVLAAAKGELDAAATEPLLPMLRDRLDRVRPEVERALDDARTGAAAAEVVPAMLGADGPRRYLVLFTSPAEARGRFGFPGAYATVLVEDGRLELEVAQAFTRIQGNVAADQSAMPLDDELVAPYIAYGATRNWLQLTVIPDFPTVATIAEELWRQTGTGTIDGVLRLDTTALATLVGFTGPVAVDARPEPLTQETVTRYLDYDQYVEFGDTGNVERKDALEDLAGVVFDRLLAVDLPGPRGLADALDPMVDGDHLQFAVYDPAAMAFLDGIGVTGRFAAPTTPDALAVAGTNITGNKIDAFLRRTVDYTATVADDGGIEAAATVELTNEATAEGLPFYVNGNVLPADQAPPRGTNRTVALVWSALPLESVTVDGARVAASSTLSGGWWVHGVSVEIPPGETATMVMDLAGPSAAGGPYALHIVPGGAAIPDVLSVAVDNEDGEPLVATQRTITAPFDLGRPDGPGR
ncbi:MAG: DUF4012 domain-containing protein [Acidimicrobiia bacterium]|nr:DUF4012 domain-containing protein [Acidimicrobiia bacterium]